MGRRPPGKLARRPRSEVLERDGMTLQVFPDVGRRRAANSVDLWATRRGCPGAATKRPMSKPGWLSRGRSRLALGLWGRISRNAAGRFGEFLAVAGVAAYRPSEGQGRPDFEHSGRRVRAEGARALRAGIPDRLGGRGPLRGDGGSPVIERVVPLSRIAVACLDQVGGGVVGVVIAGESDGLVGAAMQAVAGRSARRRRPVRPPRRTRLALAHARARAQPKHGPGRGRGDPRARPGGRSLRPAARRGGIAGKW